MDKLTLIFSLSISHEWYGDRTPALEISPAPTTDRELNRNGLLYRAIAGGCEVYSSSEDFSASELQAGSELEFCVFSRDPYLFAHTYTGESEARGIPKVAHVTLTPEAKEKTIDPDDWQPAELPNEPLVMVSVILPLAELPLIVTLRMPAISVHWSYVVDGPWLPDNLEITASDGTKPFTEISASANDVNDSASANTASATASATARIFRSLEPKLSMRTDQTEYRLVSSDSTTGPLVSPLPSPTPNTLPRPVAGSDAFEIPIYVTVLAKGSS